MNKQDPIGQQVQEHINRQGVFYEISNYNEWCVLIRSDPTATEVAMLDLGNVCAWIRVFDKKLGFVETYEWNVEEGKSTPEDTNKAFQQYIECWKPNSRTTRPLRRAEIDGCMEKIIQHTNDENPAKNILAQFVWTLFAHNRPNAKHIQELMDSTEPSNIGKIRKMYTMHQLSSRLPKQMQPLELPQETPNNAL